MDSIKKDITLGTNRGLPRLWLEGKQLSDRGFIRHAHFTIKTFTDKTLVLVLDPAGERKVSGKTKNGADYSIIDINGALLNDFAGVPCTLTIEEGKISLRRKQ